MVEQNPVYENVDAYGAVEADENIRDDVCSRLIVLDARNVAQVAHGPRYAEEQGQDQAVHTPIAKFSWHRYVFSLFNLENQMCNGIYTHSMTIKGILLAFLCLPACRLWPQETAWLC